MTEAIDFTIPAHKDLDLTRYKETQVFNCFLEVKVGLTEKDPTISIETF